MFNQAFKRELASRTNLSILEVHNFLVDYYSLMGEWFVDLEEGKRIEIREFGYFEKTRRKSQVIKSIDGIEKATKPVPDIKFHLSPTIRNVITESERDGIEKEG